MTSLWLTSNERMASRAPTYRVELSSLSNSVVVLWMSEWLKWGSSRSAESEHKQTGSLSLLIIVYWLVVLKLWDEKELVNETNHSLITNDWLFVHEGFRFLSVTEIQKDWKKVLLIYRHQAGSDVRTSLWLSPPCYWSMD